MSAGALLASNQFGSNIMSVPQPDLAVAPNFERFDGIDQPPLDHPASAQDPGDKLIFYPGGPRAGLSRRTPLAEQTYTPGVVSGVTGTLGGQPLPVADRLHRVPGNYTPSKTPSIQWRLGDGQAYQGIAQTVALSEITGSPPVPGDITGIIAGIG